MLINKYRLNIGLPVMVNGFNMIERLKVPQTYCMSPHLAAKPSDWGPHIDVVGFWFLDLMSRFFVFLFFSFFFFFSIERFVFLRGNNYSLETYH